MMHDLIPTPREIDLEITSACNLRCSYCYHFDNPDYSYRDLSYSDWTSFFHELAESQVLSVTFAGGEPFIRKDFMDLISALIRFPIRYRILTNGSLITTDHVTAIQETGRCDSIQVSLDGSCAEIHDLCRGKGSFDAAVQAIKLMKRHGVPVEIRLTIHKNNIDDLENAAEFILNNLEMDSFGTNSAAFLGSCKINADQLTLTPEERFLAMQHLLAVNKKYPGRVGAMAGPLADAKIWTQMVKSKLSHAPAFPTGGRLTGCGCTFDRLAVRCDGAILACCLLPSVILGWINKDSLIDVWLHSKSLAEIRQRESIPLNSFDYCRDCEYQPYCTGNCPALAASVFGKVNHPSPDGCLRRYLAQNGKLPTW